MQFTREPCYECIFRLQAEIMSQLPRVSMPGPRKGQETNELAEKHGIPGKMIESPRSKLANDE